MFWGARAYYNIEGCGYFWVGEVGFWAFGVIKDCFVPEADSLIIRHEPIFF